MSNLMRWDPWRELEDFNGRLSKAFSRPETRSSMWVADWAPVVDIAETNEEFLLKTELPGIDKNDVKVNVHDGTLTISGERKEEKEEKGKKLHRIERHYGSFLRSFTLPESVDATKIAAEQKDGILTVHLPKSAVAKPKALEVKVH